MTDPKEIPANFVEKHDDIISPAKSNMSKSMHDGVEVWCDCCSCEAEPYWVEAMKDFDERSSRNKK